MRVKFQADADLDGRVIRGLQRAPPEIDIRTAADAGLKQCWTLRSCGPIATAIAELLESPIASPIGLTSGTLKLAVVSRAREIANERCLPYA
jgi:hypothetical protein